LTAAEIQLTDEVPTLSLRLELRCGADLDELGKTGRDSE
jgi:hypothetical protein